MNKQIISILTIFLMISCLGCIESFEDPIVEEDQKHEPNYLIRDDGTILVFYEGSTYYRHFNESIRGNITIEEWVFRFIDNLKAEKMAKINNQLSMYNDSEKIYYFKTISGNTLKYDSFIINNITCEINHLSVIEIPYGREERMLIGKNISVINRDLNVVMGNNVIDKREERIATVFINEYTLMRILYGESNLYLRSYAQLKESDFGVNQS